MFDKIDISSAIVNFESFDISQLGQAFLYGGSVLLIGMLAVFSVLCILWVFLTVFKLVFHDLPAKRPVKIKQTPIVAELQSVNKVSQVDDGEIVAVIAAAIAMAESEDSGMKFRVVSFKRV